MKSTARTTEATATKACAWLRKHNCSTEFCAWAAENDLTLREVVQLAKP